MIAPVGPPLYPLSLARVIRQTVVRSSDHEPHPYYILDPFRTLANNRACATTHPGLLCTLFISFVPQGRHVFMGYIQIVSQTICLRERHRRTEYTLPINLTHHLASPSPHQAPINYISPGFARVRRGIQLPAFSIALVRCFKADALSVISDMGLARTLTLRRFAAPAQLAAFELPERLPWLLRWPDLPQFLLLPQMPPACVRER